MGKDQEEDQSRVRWSECPDVNSVAFVRGTLELRREEVDGEPLRYPTERSKQGAGAKALRENMVGGIRLGPLLSSNPGRL